MDVYLVVLRLFHIVCGVFWAGAAFFNALILEPAVSASGQEGQKTMGAIQRVGFTTLFGIASGLTMLSGLLLYGRSSGGFNIDWIVSPQGLVLTIGAVAGFIGAGVGGGMVGRAASDLQAIGAAVAQSGGKPSDEQAGQIASLKSRMHTGTQANAILLLIAVICMSVGPELIAR